MARSNKATVTDESLGQAFAQGVNEGLRLTGYVSIIIETKKRSANIQWVAVADVPATVNEFLTSLRADDYEDVVSIRIMAEEGNPPTEEQAELDDGIEDAEVVEE